MALHPVILAGGSGTRLWPLSRQYFPKQFFSFSGDHSLFQETIHRLSGVQGTSAPVVVCNEEHRFLVAEQAREIDRPAASIILEPVGRNTAPALTLAALFLTEANTGCQDPVMVVMPADHLIRDIGKFQSIVYAGVPLAQAGYLVTFGIVPTSPKTGYGYIKKGEALCLSDSDGSGQGFDGTEAFGIASFVEKPDESTAGKMLESEDYLWNSGIFMMRTSVWLEQMQLHRPDIADACREAHAAGESDGDFYRPEPDLFAACPSDSIDYAVMEKVTPTSGKSGPDSARRPQLPETVVLPLDAGWSDVGAWSAFWEEGNRDAEGNVVQGDVYVDSMRDSLLIGQYRLLAAVGLEDVIVVETADAVLVAHKDHVQGVKGLVARLQQERRSEHENHRKVHRPWGSYETVDEGPRFKVKRLTVNPGAALSLQTHFHRAEHWVVVKGTAKVTRADSQFHLTEDESTYVPVGTKHRLENPGATPLEIIEVQSGSYLGEDDIVRYEDRYNRYKEPKSSP